MSLRDVTFLDFIQDRIQQVEERMRFQSDGYSPELKFALEYILSAGGKRIRPAIVLLVGGMLGGKPDTLITLGASLELLHTATLVHDDLIDGSLLRRGNFTLNANWSPAATVLAGDYLFSRSASLGADLDNLAISRLFADTLAAIVSGEITQLFGRQRTADREAYYQRICEKTASLFVFAAKAAAMVSNVDEEAIEYASSYGHELGMAFQIVDDILDFTGEQATVGKPVGSDLRQGIITLPAICYQELHPSDDSIAVVFKGDVEKAQIERLIASIQASEAIEHAHQEAEQFAKRAIAALEKLPGEQARGKEKQALRELAEFVVSRRV